MASNLDQLGDYYNRKFPEFQNTLANWKNRLSAAPQLNNQSAQNPTIAALAPQSQDTAMPQTGAGEVGAANGAATNWGIKAPGDHNDFWNKLSTAYQDGSLANGFRNPVTQGLLTMGLSMLATPPREQPYSNLEVLGRGGLSGVQAMNAANTEQFQREQLLYKNNLELAKMAETSGYHTGMLDVRNAALNKPISTPGGLWKPGADETGKIIPGTTREPQPTTGTLALRAARGDQEAKSAVELLKGNEGKSKTPEQIAEGVVRERKQKAGDNSPVSMTEIHDQMENDKADANLGYHVEKRQIGKEKVQDYRVFVNKEGKVTSEEKIGVPYANTTENMRLRVEAFGSMATNTPGVIYDRANKAFYENQIQPDGTLKRRELSSDEVKSMNLEYTQGKAEAGQRGGPMSAQINAANDLYQTNLPKIIELRNKVAAKGLLSANSKLKDINQFKEWLQMKTSDPDMAELQGKVKLMADNLQKTIGGGQGGEWAFKLADMLLDPSLGGPALTRRLMSHGEDISTLAKSRRNFGKNPVATPNGSVDTSDMSQFWK